MFLTKRNLFIIEILKFFQIHKTIFITINELLFHLKMFLYEKNASKKSLLFAIKAASTN